MSEFTYATDGITNLALQGMNEDHAERQNIMSDLHTFATTEAGSDVYKSGLKSQLGKDGVDFGSPAGALLLDDALNTLSIKDQGYAQVKSADNRSAKEVGQEVKR